MNKPSRMASQDRAGSPDFREAKPELSGHCEKFRELAWRFRDK
jgi:hypothetical protein